MNSMGNTACLIEKVPDFFLLLLHFNRQAVNIGKDQRFFQDGYHDIHFLNIYEMKFFCRFDIKAYQWQ